MPTKVGFNPTIDLFKSEKSAHENQKEKSFNPTIDLFKSRNRNAPY